MMTFRRMSIFVVAAAFPCMPALGGVVGYWNFDTIADTTDAGGGEQFYEDANNLHFTRPSASGTVLASSEVTTVGPANAFTLDMQATMMDTPVTDKFSIGRTGELTIQFWYKPMLADTYRYILSQSGTNNAWSMYQTLLQPNGKAAIEFSAVTNSGVTRTIVTPAMFDATSGWSHIALTIDATGTATFYQNGTQVSSASGFTGFSSYSSPLRIGAAPATGSYANSFVMDDLMIHDVALPSGSGSAVGELAWSVSISRGLTPATRDTDFGRQWLKNNPFMINSWDTTRDVNDLDYFTDANLNSAMSGWYIAQGQAGIQQHLLGGYTELTDAARNQLHIAKNLPNLGGWMVKDEIAPGDIEGVAEIADYIRSIDPNGIIYAGMGSSNPAYIADVVEAVKPDALIHGYYPFFGSSGTDVDGHFSDFASYRYGAMQQNLPFFVYVQSFSDPGTIENRRLPSESELRFETFTKLTGGAQGIAYFTFDATRAGGAVTEGLLDRDGIPTSLYEPAQQINIEVANIGAALRSIRTTAWRYVPGMTGSTTNDLPQDMVAFTHNSAIDPNLISVAVDTSNPANKGALKDGVIGWFEDDNGELYFMLTNVYHGTGLSSAATSLDFVVTFDSSITEILRLNRLTGQQELIPLANHVLYLTLPGGTGDLFKYNVGDFAGITLVPEPSACVLGLLTAGGLVTRRRRVAC